MSVQRDSVTSQVTGVLRGPFVVAALVCAAFACGVLAAAAGYGDDREEPANAAPAAQAPSGASTGVYTAEQAELGGVLFAQRCSGCHAADLSGGFGPRLAPLGAHWRGMSLGALFRFVSRNMPYDAPGSLATDQYLEAVAFVLSRNGYPAGPSALIDDAAHMDLVLLDEPASRP